MSSGTRLNTALKTGLTLAFLWWLVFRLDWEAVIERLGGLRPGFLVLYILLILASMLLSAWKWRIIARAVGFDLAFRRAYALYLTGTFVNNFLPSFVGGDTYRALRLGRRNDSLAPAFATVMFDRLTGLLGTMVLATLCLLAAFPVTVSHPTWRLALVVLASGLLAALFFPFLRRLPVPAGRLARFREALTAFGTQGKDFWVATLGLGALFNLVGVGLSGYLLFFALGETPPFIPFLGAIFVISIVSSLPITINNIGLKEWAYYYFFGLLGLDPALAVTAALTGRVVQMFLSFLGLPLYLTEKKEASGTPLGTTPA